MSVSVILTIVIFLRKEKKKTCVQCAQHHPFVSVDFLLSSTSSTSISMKDEFLNYYSYTQFVVFTIAYVNGRKMWKTFLQISKNSIIWNRNSSKWPKHTIDLGRSLAFYNLNFTKLCTREQNMIEITSMLWHLKIFQHCHDVIMHRIITSECVSWLLVYREILNVIIGRTLKSYLSISSPCKNGFLTEIRDANYSCACKVEYLICSSFLPFSLITT